MCRPFTLREICQGHECGAASSPLTTRAPGGREPHPEIQQYMQDYGVNRQMKTQNPRLPYMIVTFLWIQIKVIPKIKKAPVTDHEEICGLGSFTRIERKMNCIVLFFFFFYAEKWEASCDLETEILIWLHISTCTCSQEWAKKTLLVLPCCS